MKEKNNLKIVKPDLKTRGGIICLRLLLSSADILCLQTVWAQIRPQHSVGPDLGSNFFYKMVFKYNVLGL